MRISLDGNVIRRMYENDGMSIHDIANEIGCSVGTVYNFMRNNGIPRRSKSEVVAMRVRNGWVYPLSGREKLSKANKGKIISDEAKKKMSDSHKIGGIGHKKVRQDGYIQIYFPDHPKSNADGYIMEHVLVMECAIGRWVKPDEVVHHKNHDRQDNRIENLQLMTHSEHMRMHMQERWQNGEVNHRTSHVVNLDTGERFASIKEAAKKYCVASSNISRACRHASRTSKGCHWAYIEGSDDLSTSQSSQGD